MKLTKIIPQVKRADRVSVFVDEEYVFSLSLDQLVASGLKSGDEISPEQIADYQQVSNEGKLFDRVLIWALRRPHSEREIRDYLKRKTDDPDLVEVLVKKLAGKDFVDDMNELWEEARPELVKQGVIQDTEASLGESVKTLLIQAFAQKAHELTATKKRIRKPNTQFRGV